MKKTLLNRRNIIVADFKLDSRWQIWQSFLKQSNIWNWEFEGYDNCGLMKNSFDNMKRLLLYFIIPIKYFFRYKQINLLVAYQQFYGIILSYYLRLFRRKELGHIVILTFIYKEKKGFIGNIYHKFVKYGIESVYVKKLICFSKSELQYYQLTFPEIAHKFEFTYLGKTSHGLERIDDSSEYLLAAGRSNRDYTFLIDALVDANYTLKIVNDSLSDENKKKCIGNIELYNQTFESDYLELMRHAKIVVIPLKDTQISSGQLVTLQAMEMGVPVVVLGSSSIDDYIVHGVNGYILEKNKTDLINTLDMLFENREVYNDISKNGKSTYWKQGSVQAMGKELAIMIDKLNA